MEIGVTEYIHWPEVIPKLDLKFTCLVRNISVLLVSNE